VSAVNIWFDSRTPRVRVATDSLCQGSCGPVHRQKLHVIAYPALVITGRGPAIWPASAVDAVNRLGATDVDAAADMIESQLPSVLERYRAAVTESERAMLESRAVLMMVGWSNAFQSMRIVSWDIDPPAQQFKRQAGAAGSCDAVYLGPYDESIAALKCHDFPDNLDDVVALVRAQAAVEPDSVGGDLVVADVTPRCVSTAVLCQL
jgi:hypothetical protein